MTEEVGLEPTSRFLHDYSLANCWLAIRSTPPYFYFIILLYLGQSFYPRAKTNPQISLAPAFLRVLAHSSKVAPVVKTSSTKITILFLIRFAGWRMADWFFGLI